MTPTKIIKDAFNKGMRHLKHRKGFGVHSPFAYDIINQVIEERCAYYAYHTMQRVYGKGTPVTMKAAALLLRLANRFCARRILEVNCDGGFSILPIVLTDSRNEIVSIATEAEENVATGRLRILGARARQVSFVRGLSDLPENYRADMVIISGLPAGYTEETFYQWLNEHTHSNSIFWLYSIRPKRPLDALWDRFCDDDNLEITMDLYDYGLAIHRPHFFKQHYVVSF